MRWSLQVEGSENDLELLDRITEILRSAEGGRPQATAATESFEEWMEQARKAAAPRDAMKEMAVLTSDTAYQLLREVSDNAQKALVALSVHVLQEAEEGRRLETAFLASQAKNLGFTDEEIAAKVGADSVGPDEWDEVSIDRVFEDFDMDAEFKGSTWSGWMSSVGAALKRLGMGKLYVADYNRRTFAMKTETANAILTAYRHMQHEDEVLAELESPEAVAANEAALRASREGGH